MHKDSTEKQSNEDAYEDDSKVGTKIPPTCLATTLHLVFYCKFRKLFCMVCASQDMEGNSRQKKRSLNSYYVS